MSRNIQWGKKFNCQLKAIAPDFKFELLLSQELEQVEVVVEVEVKAGVLLPLQTRQVDS